MADPQASKLFGREIEERLIRDLIDDVQGRGGELVVRGEAGVGKSSLLQTAADYAEQRGVRVLRSSGIQSETNLPFAGLHQLLRPVQSGINALAAPQRQALLAAFGSSNEHPPDLFLIALATLNLLAEVATTAPLLVIADDAQFIDRPTCDVMVFVARRLSSDPIVLLSAVRDGYQSALLQANLRELRLDALKEDAARALLDARAPGLSDDVRQLLLDQAAGNPLALAELPLVSLVRGGTPLAVLPLSGRLEEAFTSRNLELPDTTRTLLLVAAANDTGNVSEIADAAAKLNPLVSSDDLQPAVSARLVVVDGPELRFRHPLVRSGIHQAAVAEERRAAHGALATRVRSEPDRAAWHLAAATLGTNDEVATEMATASERALQRGALAVGVSAMVRAADFAKEPQARNDYLLRAAQIATSVEPRAEVLRLLERIDASSLNPAAVRQFESVKELAAAVPYSDVERPRYLAELAMAAFEENDERLALDLLGQAGSRCYLSTPVPETRALICSVADQMTELHNDPRLIASLALADPLERGAEVSELVSQAVLGQYPPDVELHLCNAAVFYGGYEQAAAMLPPITGRLRAVGNLPLLSNALMMQSWVALHLVDLASARAAVDEGLRLSSGYSDNYLGFLNYGEFMVAALRGDQETIARKMSADAVQRGHYDGSPLNSVLQLVAGVALLGQLRFTEAFERLKRLFDPSDIAFAWREVTRCLSIAYLADAAYHCDRVPEAQAILRQTEALAARLPAPLLHQHMRFANALLAPGDVAGERYLDALAAGGPSTFLQANLKLAYGTWLRRQRRVIESRQFLRDACEAFDHLGTAPWEERARRELSASGETGRRRTVKAIDRLTPQEMQIAQMVASGLSNREIARQLFLSPRTVDSHLYRVFPKLGIISRSEVARALEQEAI